MFRVQQTIEATDPASWQAIAADAGRQEERIELIASDNYTSPAVMQAQGSLLA